MAEKVVGGSGIVMLLASALAVYGAGAAAVTDAEAIAKAIELTGKMTLEEKVSLLSGAGTMYLPKVERVGITNCWQFSDSSHTVRATMKRWVWGYEHPELDRSTVFPTLSALASTWNPSLASRHGQALGEEARSRGKDQMLGPGVNIMRTPLCGRNWEYMSEDPYLVSKLVVPLIRGIQKNDVAACVKHFCLNNQEYDRFNVNVTIDERTLNEIYLPAFRAAVREAGVLTLMTSYNLYDGEYCSQHPYLLKGILRDRWGFLGEIVTDWGGQRTTVAGALSGAGIEMNCGEGIRYLNNPKEGTQPLVEAVKKGEVPEAVIDEAVQHVVYVMAKTRFLDPAKRAKGSINTKKHVEVAQRIGEEAITLLKNDAGVLPFDAKQVKTVLLVGNLADKIHASEGGWSAEGNPPYEITPAKGLAEYFKSKKLEVKLLRAPLVAGDIRAGMHNVKESEICTFDTTKTDTGMSVRAWELAFWDNRELKGEPKVKTYQRILDVYWNTDGPGKGIRAGDFSCRFSTKLKAPETGVYKLGVTADRNAVARLVVDGRTVIERAAGGASDMADCDLKLEAGREYAVAVEYSAAEKQTYCKFTWLLPSERGMDMAEVRSAAEKADAVLVFTGTELGHGQAHECEGADRPNLKTPEGHDEAISKILGWKLKNTVVINHSGSPMEFPWLAQCPTLVQQPYLGQEAGRPLAKVLFGEVNPSGRLPCTWPKKLEDTAAARVGTYTPTNSVYNERFYVGYRWHDHAKIEPMFPFGYGLSYTTFKYEVLGATNGLAVAVKVTNTGKVAGKETVQLYASYPDSKVERVVKELKDFRKIEFGPGQSKTVVLRTNPRDLAYWDTLRHRFVCEAGEVELLVGANAADIKGGVKVRVPSDRSFAD